MPKRPFDQVSVTATGTQSFYDRFGKRRRYDEETPTIASWRCNLTGLSQTRNLYFVAYGQDIHVFEPRFPTQAITSTPALIFTSQPSSDRLRGYLDPEHPHAINSLIVQDLGNEEVVAVVRDDGDVDAFLVRHIAQAIECRAEGGHTLGVVADEIKPMFQDNVERSAWGLAIHSQARILATSSNKHEVRIFKFGLIANDEESSAHSSSDEEDDSLTEDERDPMSTTQVRDSREQDVTLHVINGNSNIPYIAFCNTGDDPEGRWLLTTDIGGFCRVMDLQQSVASQTFRFGQSFAGNNIGGLDRLNAGWTIMFLDKRGFQPEQDLHSALGMRAGDTLPNLRDNSGIWDISRTAKQIKGASEPFIYHRLRRSRPDHPPLDIRSPSGQSVTSSVTESHDSTRPPTSSDTQEPSVDIEIDVDVSEEDGGSDDDEGGVEIEVEHSISNEDEVMATAPRAEADNRNESSEEEEWRVGIVDDDDDPEDEGTEDSVAFTNFYNGDSVCGNDPRFAHLEDNGGTLCNDLPCPILHASVRNIYLLQPSNQQIKPGPWVPPMVGMANPLRQPIQHNFEYLRVFERLNMSAQIPALGIVVVASQKGRVLVLGLTKLAVDAEYPVGVLGEEPEARKTTYGMRIECIVPLAAQERANKRPFAPLHGLAVSPLQGCEEVGSERKRWRLVLMYQDHSILSYEISRRGTEQRDSGVDVDNVLV